MFRQGRSLTDDISSVVQKLYITPGASGCKKARSFQPTRLVIAQKSLISPKILLLCFCFGAAYGEEDMICFDRFVENEMMIGRRPSALELVVLVVSLGRCRRPSGLLNPHMIR